MEKRKKTGGGNRKGIPNKNTKALKDMILAALSDAGGQKYLATQAIENPASFLTLIGKVLPTTLAGSVDLNVKPAEELIRLKELAIESARERTSKGSE